MTLPYLTFLGRVGFESGEILALKFNIVKRKVGEVYYRPDAWSVRTV